MVRLLRSVVLALFGIVSAGAAHAALMPQDPTSVGTLATSPWFTGSGDRITVTTVTNGSSAWHPFHIKVFSDTWDVIDRECQLSPMETTYLVFERFDDAFSKLTFECSVPDDPSDAMSPAADLNQVATIFVPGTQGFSIVQAKTGGALNGQLNILISDFLVVDFAGGYAFSANAWHISGLDAANEDCNYKFDGTEFAPLPAVVASSFIAPDDSVTADLVLYNLDGSPGWPAPAKHGALAYDDDETPVSAFYAYDCFVVASLVDLFGPNVLRRPGYFVGHFTLFAVPAKMLPDGTFVSIPSIGWIVQTVAGGGSLNGGQSLGGGSMLSGTMADRAAWARMLLHTPDSLPSHLFADPTGVPTNP